MIGTFVLRSTAEELVATPSDRFRRYAHLRETERDGHLLICFQSFGCTQTTTVADTCSGGSAPLGCGIVEAKRNRAYQVNPHCPRESG